jgi:hypothetical protein
VRTATLLSGLLLVWPAALAAQQIDEPLVPVSDDTLVIAPGQPTPRHDGVLLLAGVGGMVAGALGGGLIGIGIDDDDGLDAAEGALIGGVMGTSLAIPAAVHLANGSRGNLGRSLLWSALLGGAMLGVGWAAENGEIVVAAPFVQLLTSIVIERNTSR